MLRLIILIFFAYSANAGRVDRKVWASDHHRGDGGHRQAIGRACQ